MPNWYRFEKASRAVDIYILDFIGDWVDDYWGFGITAKGFLAQLAALPSDVDTIRVHINSPGGDVFSALTIANALRTLHQESNKTVTTIIEGLAASAASLIAMGGSSIQMADNTLMMIHDPWTVVRGNAGEMRKTAAYLDTVRDSAVATYRWHSELSVTAIRDLMAADTYMTAQEAVDKGFATSIISGAPITKRFPRKVIAQLRVPERVWPIAKAFIADDPAFTIAKTNVLKKQVFGWASVAVTTDGQTVVDAHQHVIDPSELEHAVYQFNLHHRELDDNHTDPVEGQLIESLVVTPDKLQAMGLSSESLPQGWWVGFQLENEAVFAKVLSGEYTMFSIAGTASLIPVE